MATAADRGADSDALSIFSVDMAQALDEVASRLSVKATIEVTVRPHRPGEFGITVSCVPSGQDEGGRTLTMDFTAEQDS